MRIKEVRSFLNRYLRAIIILQRAYPQVKRQNYMSSEMAGQAGSVYLQAHKKATSQTFVYESIYDKAGSKLGMLPGGLYPNNVARSEWYVIKGTKSKVIQYSYI